LAIVSRTSGELNALKKQ